MVPVDPPSPVTRSSLLSRARDPANHAAWQEMEDRYRDLLVRFCCKRRFQHADAEDIVQIVFLNLAKTLPQFVYDRSRGRFRDYLYRSVRNAMSLLARRIRGQADPLDTKAAETLEADANADPEADSLWHEEVGGSSLPVGLANHPLHHGRTEH